MLETLKKVILYILIGVGIGAFIHNWIPEDFIVGVLGSGNPLGVVLATLCGVPMYADIFGTIPIALSVWGFRYRSRGKSNVDTGCCGGSSDLYRRK